MNILQLHRPKPKDMSFSEFMWFVQNFANKDFQKQISLEVQEEIKKLSLLVAKNEELCEAYDTKAKADKYLEDTEKSLVSAKNKEDLAQSSLDEALAEKAGSRIATEEGAKKIRDTAKEDALRIKKDSEEEMVKVNELKTETLHLNREARESHDEREAKLIKLETSVDSRLKTLEKNEAFVNTEKERLKKISDSMASMMK